MRARSSATVVIIALVVGFVAVCQASVDVKKALATKTVSAVCGSVRDVDNSPVPDVRIVLVRKSDGVVVAETRSGQSGSYKIPSVPAGRYVVTVEPPRSFHKVSQEIKVRGKTDAACRLNVFLCMYGMECISHLWVEKK